jgi:hypothetical protein
LCGAFSTQGDVRNIYRIFVEKPKKRKQLGRPELRSEDNIETDLEKGV